MPNAHDVLFKTLADPTRRAILQRLAQGSFDLVEVILECADRLEAVITFVAVLELLRRGEIRVRQDRNFGRILVETR